MPKQATKTSAATAFQKFKGKTFAICGKLQRIQRDRAEQLIEMEGGKLLDDVTVKLDYLVAGGTRTGSPSAAEKKASQLNQKKGAAIQVISESDFLALFSPTRDEAIAMLKGGAGDNKRWRLLRNVPMPDLSGADLQGWKILEGTGLQHVIDLKLDGANLRGSELSGLWVREFHNVTLDDAILTNCHLGTWSDCSATKARLQRCSCYGFEFQRCDFTESQLSLEGQKVKFIDCGFRNVDLTDCMLPNGEFNHTDLNGANLSNAHLREALFRDADLSGTKLTNADLTRAKFVNCNLSQADLRGAILLETDLSGVTSIDGANFEGANLALANLGGLDLSKATGLDPARSSPKGKVGPNVLELERIAGKSDRLTTSIRLDLGGLDLGSKGSVDLEAKATKYGAWSHYTLPNKTVGYSGNRKSLSASMMEVANRWGHGTLLLDSINVKASKAPLGGKELKNLAIAAWCEVLGVDIPSEEMLKEKLTTQKANQAEYREQLLAELRGGAKGVEKWNARKLEDRQGAGRFRRVDLSGAKLRGAHLGHLDFQGANFEGATLIDGGFACSKLAEVNFKGSNLKGARLRQTKCQSSVFHEAILAKCDLTAAYLREADFTNADLRGADLSFSNVAGADFSGADLGGVKFEGTRFDEHTKFPKGFKPTEGLTWAGTGPDPRTVKKIRKRTGPLDAETFMKELEKHTDAAKLSKALAMLKADRFKLYAQVADDFLTGVVKSQNDPNLVYSCRLSADGTYACCTQNLNICGGLRGSLCKHLLVLIVGLSKSGELDPTRVYGWIEGSRAQKPVFDKDIMSETFLRYKGAEAGEVDWRPTETIPEDYYAM